jgi:hypothetical protein
MKAAPRRLNRRMSYHRSIGAWRFWWERRGTVCADGLTQNHLESYFRGLVSVKDLWVSFNYPR